MAQVSLTVTLYMSELIYDVENKTYLTGRSRSNGTNHEEVANMQASEDDENRNQILRSFTSSLADLKTKLSEYFSSTATTGNDALISRTDNITVTLAMPSNYNKATVETITSALHQYMVNSAVGDWFAITNKADASDYVSKAAANLETLREALNKRIRPSYTNPE